MDATLWSAQAGFCAALASVCAKIAFYPDIENGAVQACGYVIPAATCAQYALLLGWLSRGLFGALMIVSNMVMLTSFTKALHLSTSIMATVGTTSFNFTCTAIMSMIIFGETLPAIWWGGFACILAGLAVLGYGQHLQEQRQGKQGDKSKVD